MSGATTAAYVVAATMAASTAYSAYAGNKADQNQRSAQRQSLRTAQDQANATEQARRQGLVAEDRARLHRADGVPPDRPVRGPQFDAGQLRGPRSQGFESVPAPATRSWKRSDASPPPSSAA